MAKDITVSVRIVPAPNLICGLFDDVSDLVPVQVRVHGEQQCRDTGDLRRCGRGPPKVVCIVTGRVSQLCCSGVIPIASMPVDCEDPLVACALGAAGWCTNAYLWAVVTVIGFYIPVSDCCNRHHLRVGRITIAGCAILI